MGVAGGAGHEIDAGHIFLCGADMDPTTVLRAHPGARFVARARVVAGDGSSGAGAGVWGILVRVPGEGGEGGEGTARIETDDGRPFTARLEGGGRPVGEPGAILAAARYWELPPAYVAELQAALGADEEGAERG